MATPPRAWSSSVFGTSAAPLSDIRGEGYRLREKTQAGLIGRGSAVSPAPVTMPQKKTRRRWVTSKTGESLRLQPGRRWSAARDARPPP
jgi:hypothetical protein